MGARVPWRLRCAVALLAALALPNTEGRATAAPVCNDVALVLAVDSSTSVSPGEFLLQKRGIAAAFRDPLVLDAIKRAGQVIVSVVFWGSEAQPKNQSGWVLVDGVVGAERFARAVEAMPRRVAGDTGLGSGLLTALDKVSAPDLCAVRRIINLSGDGTETRAVRGKRRLAQPPQVRDLAATLQVEINALAILSDEADLARYYAQNVITGPDAFVMDVSDYGGFAQALRRKLIREISPRIVSQLPVLEPAADRLN